MRRKRAKPCRHRYLYDGPREGNSPYGHKFFKGKMQANTEHQQYDADFSELICKTLIGDKTGCERADDHAREQISDQRGQPQPKCSRTEDEGKNEARDDHRDQRSCVLHY